MGVQFVLRSIPIGGTMTSHDAMGCQLDPSWWPVELFLVAVFHSWYNKDHGMSSVVRAFAHRVIGHWINPSCGPTELFLVLVSAP